MKSLHMSKGLTISYVIQEVEVVVKKVKRLIDNIMKCHSCELFSELFSEKSPWKEQSMLDSWAAKFFRAPDFIKTVFNLKQNYGPLTVVLNLRFMASLWVT